MSDNIKITPWELAQEVVDLRAENAALRAALERWQRLVELGLEDVVPDFMEPAIISISKQTNVALGYEKEEQP